MSSQHHFYYTKRSGEMKTAKNAFHNLEGQVEDPNGRPVETSVFKWNQTSLSRQIQKGKPSSWDGLPHWPPHSVWDAFKVGHKPNRRCIHCQRRTQACHCDPLTWLATLHNWAQDFYLYDKGDGRGPGVYARRNIARDQVLGIYAGKLQFGVVSETQGSYDMMLWSGDYTIFDDGEDDDDLRINAEKEGNWTRFVNHSCAYNSVYARVRVGEYELPVVQTIKAVAAHEELAVDYGEEYFNYITCLCGASNCLETQRDGPMTEDAFSSSGGGYGSERRPGHGHQRRQSHQHSGHSSGHGATYRSGQSRRHTSGQSSGHHSRRNAPTSGSQQGNRRRR